MLKQNLPKNYVEYNGNVIPMKYYRYMRGKMKISYEACRQEMTISELIVYALLKTYKQQEAELKGGDASTEDNKTSMLKSVESSSDSDLEEIPDWKNIMKP